MTTTAPMDDDPELAAAYRRLAEERGAAPGAIVDTSHLKRQSLAAHHFVEAVADEVRFDHGRGEWYLWSGHRWVRDLDAGIRRRWLEVLAARYRAALAIADGDARDRAIAAIQTAGATDGAIESGLRIAASMVPLAMTGAEWDPDPWLLGCENGVVDLRTGEPRPGRPEDLITRSTGLAFDPDAPRTRWLRFLDEVIVADAELTAWFRRLVGASLVGTAKEVVAVHHGGGNNGKSVCFGVLGRAIGDYGVEIGVETLLSRKRQAGAPTPDLMRLRGARLAFTSEPDQRAKLAGGTLKRLASIDRMSGRDLHRGQQEWDPTHTVHVATNHLPEIDDPSDGMWRRIALIPWGVHFLKPGEPGDGPREDPHLERVLRAELPGVLAWIVEGAVEFAAAGTLHPFPTAVRVATETYRADEDPLSGFLAHLAPSPGRDAVTSGELHRAYDGWAEREGLTKAQRLTSRTFGRLFADRHQALRWPVERGILGGRTVYRGVRILTDPQDAAVGGSGGFAQPPAGLPNATRDVPETDVSAIQPTTSTYQAGLEIDEELAERATDEDGELPS